jgi:hypothetical protein
MLPIDFYYLFVNELRHWKHSYFSPASDFSATRSHPYSNYNLIIKHWSDRCAEDECASRDTGVQGSKN